MTLICGLVAVAVFGWTLLRAAADADARAYLTRDPAAIGRSGCTRASPLSSLAASSMPRLSIPRSYAGARLATTTICLPASVSGAW